MDSSVSGSGLTAGSGAGDGSAGQTAGAGLFLDNVSLAFDGTGSTVLTDPVDGIGSASLIVNGGTLAVNTTATVPVTVNSGGLLSVNGNITGPVDVQSGGTLGGGGQVGATTVFGTVSPGNSIGTLTVNGNYTQAAGSTYTVEANAAGQSDLINVTGTATLQGGIVNVLAAPGNYAPTTAYTILSATGGVTGTYAGVTDNLPFLDAALRYLGTSVILGLNRNDLGFGPPPTPVPTFTPFVATTPNQAAVGINLDRLEAGATGDLRTVFNKLVAGNTAQARVALDDLGGEIHATGMSLDLNAHQVFLDSIRRQSTRMDSLGSNAPTALNDKTAPKPHDGVWLQALGIGHGTMDSDGNAGTTDYNTSGISVGGDTLIIPQLRLGGAFAATFSDANVNARNSSANSDGYHAAVYSSFRPSGAALAGQGLSGPAIDSSLSYARFETETSRGIRLGDMNRNSTADYGANLFAATTEGRYGLKVGGVALEPYLGLRYQWLSRDSFRETGAGSVNLVASSNDQDSLRLGAGVRFGHNFVTQSSWLVRPEVRVGWEHEFLDDRGDLSAQFAGAAGGVPGFTILGVRTARDRAIFSAGLSMQVNPQVQLYADYTGWASGNEQVHGAIGGFRVSW
jgi:fibronectin-binding autotransporter adhesin